ncbi:MAG: hypothetical protein Q7S64_01520 [bacterium]|nr:hypothetical protein [bacterium]
MRTKMKSGFTVIEAVIIVVLIAVVAAGIAMTKKKTATTEPTTTPTATEATKTETKTTTSAKTDKMADWKTYSNTKYGFSIKYPKFDSTGAVSGGGNEEWIAKEFSGGATRAYISFGPPGSAQGGYVWGLLVTAGTTIEKQIAGQGDQWSDRKESRSTVTLDGLSATVVTVTTASQTDWTSKTVYFEKDDNIYEISTSAITSSFDNFYKSFQFTK